MSEEEPETKGNYLLQKLQNMANWVTLEVGKENLPVDIIAGINGRSVLEVTALCATLEANADLATHRNWSGLVQLMEAHNAPLELQEVIVAVQQRPAMHDKFWRYIDLFVTVVRQ
tara:strand:- start:1804 stop:2148 length:345 start_codon:yes stop_codon:yes gene_type:complete